MRGQLVYIAGYGRSGSTVLGALLGEHPRLVHVGEITYLANELTDSRRTCSCGAAYPECPVWSGLARGDPPPAALGRVTRRIERLRSFPLLWLGPARGARRNAYRSFQSALLDGIVERSGKPVVVDSSKSSHAVIGRALALERIVGYDVFVIHLVRDGRATLRSVTMSGSNWVREGFRRQRGWAAVRGIAGWTTTNALVMLQRRLFGRGRYLRLRYEDLVAHPAPSLERIGEFLHIDMSPVIERVRAGDELRIGHTVGGNRIRFERTVRLHAPSARSDGPRLRAAHRTLFTLVGGALNRFYGYSSR
ncbi:MAG: sulfotransferase family protein [Longimicrobiales bacterium]